MGSPADDDMMPPALTGLLKYGIPSAIAIWLVYILTTQMSVDLHTQTVLLQRHVDATAQLQRTVESDERWHATMTDVMRQICVNGSKNFSERSACFSAGVR